MTFDHPTVQGVEDEDTFFVDSPASVAEAVEVAEHVLRDPAIRRHLGEHYVRALDRVTRQARRDLDDVGAGMHLAH